MWLELFNQICSQHIQASIFGSSLLDLRFPSFRLGLGMLPLPYPPCQVHPRDQAQKTAAELQHQNLRQKASATGVVWDIIACEVAAGEDVEVGESKYASSEFRFLKAITLTAVQRKRERYSTVPLKVEPICSRRMLNNCQ